MSISDQRTRTGAVNPVTQHSPFFARDAHRSPSIPRSTRPCHAADLTRRHRQCRQVTLVGLIDLVQRAPCPLHPRAVGQLPLADLLLAALLGLADSEHIEAQR